MYGVGFTVQGFRFRVGDDRWGVGFWGGFRLRREGIFGALGFNSACRSLTGFRV